MNSGLHNIESNQNYRVTDGCLTYSHFEKEKNNDKGQIFTNCSSSVKTLEV